MDETGGYREYEFVAEFYDHIVPYVQRPDVNFYVGLATESRGPVLELGCGTGRVLIPTAKAAINIVGVDLSEYMLGVCQQKLIEEPADVQDRVQLVHGDIREFELGGKFTLVTIPFRPFQHLITLEDQLACLACVQRHMDPGGRFVLDVFNPDIRRLTDEGLQREYGDEPSFQMPDGRHIERRHRNASVDLHRQVLDAEIIHNVTHPDGKQERLVHSFPMRYLFRYEVEHLLTRSGFEVEAIFSDFDRSPIGSKYPGELIFVARKL